MYIDEVGTSRLLRFVQNTAVVATGIPEYRASTIIRDEMGIQNLRNGNLMVLVQNSTSKKPVDHQRNLC